MNLLLGHYEVCDFWLGTHHPHWLWTPGYEEVPLFVSRRTLSRYKTLKPKLSETKYIIDSGGFSELDSTGEWSIDDGQLAREVRRYSSEIGEPEYAAPRDYMCEPHILRNTGLTIAEHQRRTVESVINLRCTAPEVDWLPVLQGWKPDDYLRHVELYDKCGIDLVREPLVGLGSVCRRQNTRPVEELIKRLSREGIRLHGFGFKLEGLARVGKYLESADSMAWSFDARMNKRPLPGCPHKSCANCRKYALQWRERVVKLLDDLKTAPEQGDLFAEELAA
jgi:hypothetical protein